MHFDNTPLTSYQIGHMVKKGVNRLGLPSHLMASELGRRRRHLYEGFLMITSRAWVDTGSQLSNCTSGRTV